MRQLATLALCLISSLANAQTLPPLTQLGHDNREEHVWLVLFSQPDCSYCDLVRNEFLLPLQKHPPQGLAIRELKVATAGPVTTTQGDQISARDFAKGLNVRFYPSVLLLDEEGQSLTEPLVGISSRDFYGFYLDQAIDQALHKEH